MATWESGEVTANGLRLHYTRTGGGKPPLVLAHGFSDDGLCWTPLVQALEADYDCVMFDARGHGRSEGPAEGYGSAPMAVDLREAIAALGLQRPAVLGHSMGAATALMLAGTAPDVPGAILLEDPPAFWVARQPPADGQDRMASMRNWIVELKRKTGPELIAAQRADSPGWSEAEIGPWADSKLRLSFNVLNRDTAPTDDWQTIVGNITCPALLITADPAMGAIVNEESAAALQALVPHLRIAHIPGAGHSIRRDQFERYVEVVRGFLRDQR